MGHANYIPTMQLFHGISKNAQSKSYWYHWLNVSGISKIMHCGILINMLAPDQCYTPASLVRPLRWCIADSSRAIWSELLLNSCCSLLFTRVSCCTWAISSWSCAADIVMLTLLLLSTSKNRKSYDYGVCSLYYVIVASMVLVMVYCLLKAIL